MNIYKKITIIILNWNLPDDTIECLESIYQVDYPNYDVIVIDNGSTDDSVRKIKEAYPNLILLENKENLGFAEGNNVGLSYALSKDSDYFFLLNNDCIVDKYLFKNLINATLEHPDGGAFGTKVLHYDNPYTIQSSGFFWSNSKMMPQGIEPTNTSEFLTKQTSIIPTFFAHGCGALFSKKALQKSGLFDPRYFLYWEEVDLCERIRKNGFGIYYVPKAKIWHKGSKSTKKQGKYTKFYYLFRNRLLFLRKHLPLKQKLYFYFYRIPLEIFSMVLSKKFNKSYLTYYLLGLFHHITRKYGPLIK